MKAVDDNYHLTTRFAIISFIAVGITAACIFLFYRYQTVQVIDDASRRSNEVLSIATEYALNDHFILFLNFVRQQGIVNGGEVALGPTLDRAIQKLLLNTNVVRLKIYDKSGKVVYSTKQSQIGEGQEANEGFRSALRGIPKTVLIYRDTFNIFDKQKEDENLVQTYVPIKLTTTGEVKGVFEVYSDISDYINLSDRTIIFVSIIVVIVMFVLYSFLLLHINRSERIINAQNRETREKKKLLEYLTAKMINAQEDEKRRIAFELHEDVVQTVSGVKMQLERYISSVEKISDETSIRQVTQDIVPILQEAAQKIRLVAMDLRPPSLDDFGLQAAVNSLVSECHTATTGLEVQINIEVDESELTQERKSILYRMLKDTMKAACFEKHLTGIIRFILSKFDKQLMLEVKVVSEQFRSASQSELPKFLESMQERTILSGGEFSVTYDNYDRLDGKSVWNT